MGPLIVLLGFMVFTIILWIIFAETEKKDKSKILLGVLVTAACLISLAVGLNEIISFFAFLESCDSCVKGVGAMG